MSTLPGNMRVSLSSPPDREKLVAEILFENEQWAEINKESGELQLLIYPARNGQPWSFGLEDAINALSAAKARLVGGGS